MHSTISCLFLRVTGYSTNNQTNLLEKRKIPEEHRLVTHSFRKSSGWLLREALTNFLSCRLVRETCEKLLFVLEQHRVMKKKKKMQCTQRDCWFVPCGGTLRPAGRYDLAASMRIKPWTIWSKTMEPSQKRHGARDFTLISNRNMKRPTKQSANGLLLLRCCVALLC